jgi:hypothetical protein
MPINMKSNLYKAHKITGLIVFIPILLWVVSGFMHPFMSHWFKPEIPKTTLKENVIPIAKIEYRLEEALSKSRISSFEDVRIIECQKRWFYQVQLTIDSTVYIDIEKGSIVPHFDQAYAIYLARYFTDDSTSKIKSMTKQRDFDFYYREINRLLPVWKIEFERSDKMTVYVETNSSRLGTFNDKYRTAFIWIFNTFHNWEFLPAQLSDHFRLSLLLFFSGFIFITAFLGLVIYGIGWNKFKKIKNSNEKTETRRSHRKLGLAFSLFTFMFSFSGFYHALNKWDTDSSPKENKLILTQQLSAIEDSVLFNPADSITTLSVLNTTEGVYYRCMSSYSNKIKWINAETKNRSNKNMDSLYSLEQALANTQLSTKELARISFLDHFDHEYGFINKRLPVYKVEFNDNKNTTLYIEPSSKKIAAHITNEKRQEGYSFAFLHKFVFLKGLGADVKDIANMLAALTILMVAYKGIKILR